MLKNQPAPVRLYDYRFSGNSYKIRLALAQLAERVEVVPLNLITGETRSSEFLRKNPMGQVPVLELADGTCLRESNAILFWLTEDTFLMPPSPIARAGLLQWMFFEQSNIDKVLGRTRFLKAFPDFRATHAHEWDDWYRVGNDALSVMNDHLSKTSFLVNGSYSAADICLFGYVHSAEEGGFRLDDFGNVTKWIDRVRSTEGYLEQMVGAYP